MKEADIDKIKNPSLEEFKRRQAEMPTEYLLELCERAVSDMCKTGGRSFTMTVPVHPKDTDMIFCELIRRMKEQEVREKQAYAKGVDDMKDGVKAVTIRRRTKDNLETIANELKGGNGCNMASG